MDPRRGQRPTAPGSGGDRPAAGDGMLHPLVIGSIVLLAVNDHLFKAAWPGAVTGKLSDAAGLVFFPVLLVSAWELALRAQHRFVRPHVWPMALAVIVTGAAFALTKTVPWANDLYGVVLALVQWPARALVLAAQGQPPPALGRAVLARDASDLWTLPCLALPWLLERARVRRAESA